MPHRIAVLAAVGLVLLGTLSCGGPPDDTTPVLRFSAIPDEDVTGFRAKFDPAARHLSDALGVPVEYVWPKVAFTNTPEATYVPSVWAGRKIAFLVDEIRRHGENREMIKEILELSQAYGIQTPYTSWLVDPERRQVRLQIRGLEERSVVRPIGDDAGIAFSRDGTTAFGHRRLAVIDPTPAGHQPMGNQAGTLLLTYNGEIYNFRVLRGMLEAQGVRFGTRSDAEVLLKAHEHWGTRAVNHLRGMFAYAIWNEGSRECSLVRDRLGIKPLYYSQRGPRVAFASEPKAILEVCPEERVMNETEVFHFLIGGSPDDSGSETFFQNLKAVPAGTYIRFTKDNYSNPEAFWNSPDSIT